MRFTKGHRFQVLNLLHNNLKNLQPQVVSVDTIADTLQIDVEDTKQLLYWMDQRGQIQSNMEGNYSILTRTGLLVYKQLIRELSVWCFTSENLS